ncbi:MAG: ATP-binding cassette domain-containing protein [Oscillospiraceae bacterium]|nr:ATP-binding cassette domain-containing protein [Oscillospiraceae bacterium]
MINFENVSKYALNNVSIHIPKGEIVGLIGASGAGKTTMIKLSCGLLAPESGRVYTLDKNPVLNRKLYKNNISTFIAGVPLLCHDDTVSQGFELIRNMYGIEKTEFHKRYEKLSEQLDFGKYESQSVKNLSLGQRMRAELGAALIYEPKLLLLDEPNVGLDENGKSVLCEILTERCKNGMTVLMTSHDMSGVSKMCGRIALLDGGKLVFYGSEDNLRSRYAPIDVMRVKICGNIPDFEDLPLKKYFVQGDILTLSYNSNHITSAEILKLILRQTSVSEVSIRKPSLESIISQLKKGGYYELY